MQELLELLTNDQIKTLIEFIDKGMDEMAGELEGDRYEDNIYLIRDICDTFGVSSKYYPKTERYDPDFDR